MVGGSNRNNPNHDFDITRCQGRTNQQLYESENALRALMNTIGIERRERDRIINNGFTDMDEIISHHTHDVSGFTEYMKNLNKTFASSSDQDMRVYFPPVAIQRFTGVVHYCNHALNSFHVIPDIIGIDRDASIEFYKHYRDFTKQAKGEENDKMDLDVPTLNGAINWVDFRDKFEMKLSTMFGDSGLPLSYVTNNTPRDAKEATDPYLQPATFYINRNAVFINEAVHFGDSYIKDSATVWNHLKTLLIGKSAYNHISKYDRSQNGRRAWNTLKAFYEGEDFSERMRESAFSKLASTFYKGETHRFNFEKYIDLHKQCHKMLEDAGYNNGLGMDDATKIQHFKHGIRESAGLEVALTQTRSNPSHRRFDHLVSFLTAEVDHKANRKKQLNSTKDRRVSSYKTGGKPSNRRKQKGGQNNDVPSRVVDGKTLYAKQYSKQEFSSMTSKQRSAVIALNRDRRKKDSELKDAKDDDTHVTRQLASLRTDMEAMGNAIIAGVSRATGEDVSVITGDNNNENDDESSASKRKASSGAVGEFIRRTRKKGPT